MDLRKAYDCLPHNLLILIINAETFDDVLLLGITIGKKKKNNL